MHIFFYTSYFLFRFFHKLFETNSLGREDTNIFPSISLIGFPDFNTNKIRNHIGVVKINEKYYPCPVFTTVVFISSYKIVWNVFRKSNCVFQIDWCFSDWRTFQNIFYSVLRQFTISSISITHKLRKKNRRFQMSLLCKPHSPEKVKIFISKTKLYKKLKLVRLFLKTKNFYFKQSRYFCYCLTL